MNCGITNFNYNAVVMGKILSIIGWALTMEEAAKQFTASSCNSEQTTTSEEMTCQYTTIYHQH